MENNIVEVENKTNKRNNNKMYLCKISRVLVTRNELIIKFTRIILNQFEIITYYWQWKNRKSL